MCGCRCGCRCKCRCKCVGAGASAGVYVWVQVWVQVQVQVYMRGCRCGCRFEYRCAGVGADVSAGQASGGPPPSRKCINRRNCCNYNSSPTVHLNLQQTKDAPDNKRSLPGSDILLTSLHLIPETAPFPSTNRGRRTLILVSTFSSALVYSKNMVYKSTNIKTHTHTHTKFK
jgi:hypothetical protein